MLSSWSFYSKLTRALMSWTNHGTSFDQGQTSRVLTQRLSFLVGSTKFFTRRAATSIANSYALMKRSTGLRSCTQHGPQ